jgi:hypothetical protein
VRLARLLLLAAALAAAHPALAGQECREQSLAQTSVRSGLELAYRVQGELQRQNARAAIVGRIGRDLSEYGLRYSHVGLAIWDERRNAYTMVHLLNACGRADSDLYDEGLGNFFLDDLFRFEAVILVPSPPLQQKLIDAVAAGWARQLHQPAYSLIAYPYSDKYQNSNQWLLELLAAAEQGQDHPSRIAEHRWLEHAGYRPAVVDLPPLKRLGARLFAVNTRFDDHSMQEWSSSRYQIVSAESVLDFTVKVDSGAARTVISLPESGSTH